MIGIKDIIIENYRTITEGYKNIVKKEDKNKTEILQMMEEDSRNTMDIANAFLIVQKQNIYDYIPKSQYDQIMEMKPLEPTPPELDPVPAETLKYKDAPADVQRQIEEQAGLQPSQIAGPPQTPGTIPPVKNKAPENTPGVDSNRDFLNPKGQSQIQRPQSPLGASVDASVGRAANLPFFPNNN